MRLNMELEYQGLGSPPTGEPPGYYRKSFDVDWPRIPHVGESVRVGEGQTAAILTVKGVTFGVDGSVTLWFDEVKHGPSMSHKWLEDHGWEGGPY
jgi:hypothetical protein